MILLLDNHPTLILFELISIFDEREVKFLGVERDDFVVVSGDKGDIDDGLFHCRSFKSY